MGNPQNKKEKYIHIIQEYLIKMPSLSTTATKVLSVCNSPNTSAYDLNKVVSLDPVLTGNVLKLINSAYYFLRNPVTSLTQAIIMLGLNTIKNLALSSAILGTITQKKSLQKNTMDIFWTHCISTGVWAKALALETGIIKSDCEEYFVAGLLHDIGKIPLIHCFPADYMEIVVTATEKNLSLHTAEKAVFGMNHEEIGKLIVQKWKLEGAISQVICTHHHLPQTDDETHNFVERVAVADILSKITINGVEKKFPEDIFVETILQDSLIRTFLKKHNLAPATLKTLQEKSRTEIENAKLFIQIAKG